MNVTLRALVMERMAEHSPVHSLDYPSRMGFAQVGVALDHVEGLVPEDRCDFQETRSIHDQVGCGSVP